MNVILLLILASLAMALVFLGCFVWSVRSGQYVDTSTPALRVLADEASSCALPPAPPIAATHRSLHSAPGATVHAVADGADTVTPGSPFRS
jgi:cbb3-type cytochrome oxidase maturation protein